MLFESGRHSKLENIKWNPSEAKQFIEQLYLSTERDFDCKDGWSKNFVKKDPIRFSIYDGAAGTAWSQAQLYKLGYGENIYDYRAFLEQSKSLSQIELKALMPSSEYLYGLLLGKLGILVAENAFDCSKALHHELKESMLLLQDNSICEYMWAAPGALAVAAYYAKTNSEYCKIVSELANSLESQLMTSERSGVRLWKQNLYGHKVCHMGAVHGFSGNAFSILKAIPLLEEKCADKWKSLIIDTVIKTAIEEENLANWPQSVDGCRPGRDELLVQFCHGSPGIICSLSDLIGLDDDFDNLLSAGGELAWKAGPLTKGSGICHGAAGNGFAFLKLFESTKNELWLERARVFASFAIKHSQDQCKVEGSYDYSLWNGDTGLAHFIHHCWNGTSEIPTMDYF